MKKRLVYLAEFLAVILINCPIVYIADKMY